MRTSATIVGALRDIAKREGGLLKPERVVEAARPASSPLHASFTWDDGEAAHQYRLFQARQLIRTTISVVNINGDMRPVRVFVSLTPDREETEGGYREITRVVRDSTMRKQLLADALADMERFELRYRHLQEVADVLSAMRATRHKHQRRHAA